VFYSGLSRKGCGERLTDILRGGRWERSKIHGDNGREERKVGEKIPKKEDPEGSYLFVIRGDIEGRKSNRTEFGPGRQATYTEERGSRGWRKGGSGKMEEGEKIGRDISGEKRG